MANLIDQSYFYGPLLIGQSDQATVNTRLGTFIDRYEKEFFLQLFGYNFKKLYDAQILTQRMIDIRDGKEYINRWGILDKWRGLKEATPKRSPIANFVYYWYERDNVTTTAGTGEVKTNQQNSRSIYAGNKMMTAWNEMVEWNKEFWDFMYSNQDTYPEFFQDLRNWCNSNDLYKPIYYFS